LLPVELPLDSLDSLPPLVPDHSHPRLVDDSDDDAQAVVEVVDDVEIEVPVELEDEEDELDNCI